MTREERKEAIGVLENAKNFSYDEAYTKAFDLGIEALKQEPCDDAISRKAVITEIKKWWRTALDAEGSPLICETIKKMQPVTPTQKRGSWIERFNEDERWLMCTECRKDSDIAHNFCPHCGAKMVE